MDWFAQLPVKITFGLFLKFLPTDPLGLTLITKNCMGVCVILDRGGESIFGGPRGRPQNLHCVASMTWHCVASMTSNLAWNVVWDPTYLTLLSFFVTPETPSEYIEMILWGRLRRPSNALLLPWTLFQRQWVPWPPSLTSMNCGPSDTRTLKFRTKSQCFIVRTAYGTYFSSQIC